MSGPEFLGGPRVHEKALPAGEQVLGLGQADLDDPGKGLGGEEPALEAALEKRTTEER